MKISKKLTNILIELSNDSPLPDMILKCKIDKIDYLDLSHTDSMMISYLSKERKELIKNENTDLSDDKLEKLYWDKKRYIIKPGKLIKKLFSNVSTKDIEIFSNIYRGYIEKQNIKFEIVTGDRIKTYFHYNSYESHKGSLFASCMKYDKTQPYLDFYVKNPNVSLLVFFSNVDNSKIIGRSLLWNTNEGYKIMDRIYVVDDHYQYIFHEWAKENGYLYKYRNNWYNTNNFIDNDKKIELKLSVDIEDIMNFNSFPYLDTFKWIDNYKVYNYKPETNSLLLISTNGSCVDSKLLEFDGIDRFYRVSQDVRYCKYLGIHTHIRRLVKSEINNDYILHSDVILDNDLGYIFRNKKYNNKKEILKFLYKKVYEKIKNGKLNKSEFKRIKTKFNKYQREFENV